MPEKTGIATGSAGYRNRPGALTQSSTTNVAVRLKAVVHVSSGPVGFNQKRTLVPDRPDFKRERAIGTFFKGERVEKLPFTSFDFWSYLASGFLLLCAFDSAFAYGLLGRKDWNVVEGVLAVSVAYVTGHLIASLSSLFLERGLVGKVLGRPSAGLFGKSKAWKWVQKLLSYYYDELPAETQKAILDKAKAAGVSGSGEALFLLAFAKASGSDNTMSRLAEFLNQYSFCRNVALVSLVTACVFLWAHLQSSGTQQQLLFACIALVVGVALALRYLKFLRHYSLELFISFAYAEEKAKTP